MLLLLLLFHYFFIVFLKAIHLFGYPAASVCSFNGVETRG